MFSALPSFVACLSLASANLVLRDCNSSPNKIIHFENWHISVDPLQIPGPETGDINVQILQPISGNHYTLSVNFSKKVLFGYINVGCINNVGKCDYELCDLLSGMSWNNTHHCPPEVDSSSPDFPCSCPFQPGTYHLNPTTFIIPELSVFWTFLASGEYRAHAKITDKNTNEEVGCYNIQLSTVATGCSGLGCFIGK